MSRFRFSNHASALLVSTLSSTGSDVQLEAGGGAKMPPLAGGDQFVATLIAASGIKEIVTAFAVTGDVVSVDRGQEGTAAQTFPSGSRFEVRLTAGMAENFLQRDGDSMTGPLDMGGNPVINPLFSGPVKFTHINVQLLRPIDVDPSTPYNPGIELSSIVIPPVSSGTRPSYHGRTITNTEMFDGVVFDWFGDVNNVPPWLKLCDGTNGTPDLRGRFIRGWTSAFGVGGHGTRGLFMEVDPGPQPSPANEYAQTTDDGNHSHGGGVGGHGLTPAEIPANAITTTRTPVSPGGSSAVGTLDSLTHTGTGAPHGHPIGADGVHHHAVFNLPPFYVLAKVMFVFL